MTARTTTEAADGPPAPDGDEAGTGRLAPGAWRLATLPVLLALPLALVAPLAVPPVALVGVLAVLAFHRDPDRDPPASGVLAPADGRISVVREEDDGRLRVGTFMSPFDVHVNRAPLPGTVASVEHRPGAHKPAFSKDSDRNERVHVAYGAAAAGREGTDREGDRGADDGRAENDRETAPTARGDGTDGAHGDDGYEVDLIAGWFARRIHPYVQPGDTVARGERIGHISFGSRVDVVFPPAVDRTDLAVSEGDRVTAGETVLAPLEHTDDG